MLRIDSRIDSLGAAQVQYTLHLHTFLDYTLTLTHIEPLLLSERLYLSPWIMSSLALFSVYISMLYFILTI